MGKKSHKQSVQLEKEQLGCISGLISIFDFRLGRSTQRLTSGKKRGTGFSKKKIHLLTNGNEKHKDMEESASDISDGEGRKTAMFDSKQSSVKALIDEEMSKVKQPKKQIPNMEIEQNRVDSQIGVYAGENNNHASRTCDVACKEPILDSGASESLENQQSHHPNSMERLSALEEFFDHSHQYQETLDHHHAQKSSNQIRINENAKLERAGEAEEAFLKKKLMDVNQLLMDGQLNQSQEFMDALEILNSNKDLFLKLLQDPNSLLVQHIQDLQNTQEGVRLSGEEADDPRLLQKPIGNKQNNKQSRYKIFGRKDKVGEGKKSKNQSKRSDSSNTSNRIVVLKPSPIISQGYPPQPHFSSRRKGEIEKAVSHFSIKEIKRKLKHAMRENKHHQQWASMDSTLHRIPYERGNFGNTGKPKEFQLSHEYESNFPSYNSCKRINTKTVYSPRSESAIYEEAKKHLAEILSDGVEDRELLPRQDPRTLGRILSMPENNVSSPRISNGRNKRPSFEDEEMGFSPADDFRFSSESGWWFKKEVTINHSSPLRWKSSSRTNSNNQDGELEVTNSNSELLEGILPDTEMQPSVCIRGQLSSKGGMEIREISDTEHNKVTNDMAAPSEPESDRPIDDKRHYTEADENCVEEVDSECSRSESSDEKPILVSMSGSFSGSPLHINKTEDSDTISDKQERPSPVSVLDPFFVEDITPVSSGARSSMPQNSSNILSSIKISFSVKSPRISADSSIQPRQIHFEEYHNHTIATKHSDPEIDLRTHMTGKESKIEYVRTMLEASGVTHDGFVARWHSSDHPLDPSLFDEIEALSIAQPSDDRKLLFDCINEVLIEVYERFFTCSPWISFVKPNIRPIPKGENLIQEVWEGIDQLLLTRYQQTLDQIVRKDMERDGKWMDLRSEVESVGIEMGEFILDRLMEETILELWE